MRPLGRWPLRLVAQCLLRQSSSGLIVTAVLTAVTAVDTRLVPRGPWPAACRTLAATALLPRCMARQQGHCIGYGRLLELRLLPLLSACYRGVLAISSTAAAGRR